MSTNQRKHLKQLTGGQNSIARPDRLGAVHSLLAQILEQAEAAALIAGNVAEVTAIDQIGQYAVAKRALQLRVVVVDPLHQQLNGAAGVEAGRAWITQRALLNPHGLGMEFGPLAGDQGVLGAHGLPSCAAVRSNTRA